MSPLWGEEILEVVGLHTCCSNGANALDAPGDGIASNETGARSNSDELISNP
jgi:hypothetical protein